MKTFIILFEFPLYADLSNAELHRDLGKSMRYALEVNEGYLVRQMKAKTVILVQLFFSSEYKNILM